MNNLYLNNPSYQPVTRPFVFNKRNEKIDWRRIAAVDVDRVARELDFQVLQDNIEQITLCNIELEVDSRAMDPNFIKLYKMAQLTIEYLLLCQDQISNQLSDYEQTKSKSSMDHEQYQGQLDKLKNDLNLVKKESKKRKKQIEMQEKMLLAQRTTYHACPVCAHTFLTPEFLQGHMQRRHPEYSSHGRREHDVDMEKETQRLKDELHSKETELQLIKVQKAVDEEKIREREETIRQLKEEIQSLTTKITILDEKYFTVRSSTQNRTPSPHRSEAGVKELLKETKTLRAENERLRQALQEAENNLKGADKSKRRTERENQKLQSEINDLSNTLRSLQNASGDTSRLSEELIAARNRYNEEKNQRKKLQQELDEANGQLAQLLNQPPPVIDRKSPVPHPRRPASPPSHSSPSPPPPIPAPPSSHSVKKTEVFLPQYCPSLVREVNSNPSYLNRFRNEAKVQLRDELAQYDNMGISDKDTRLNSDDFPSKMDIINQTRQNIQNDLPNFERIRDELSRTLDKLATERISRQRTDSTTGRPSGGKVVKFDDEARRQEPVPAKGPSKTDRSKSKHEAKPSRASFASDEEKTNTRSSGSDGDYSQPTRSAATTDIQPSPRKNIPSTGVSALASGAMKPAITNKAQVISAIVRPQTTVQNYETESDSDSPPPANVAEKTRVLDQKLNDFSAKGQKPTVNAVAQGFRPSRQTVATRNDDDESDDSLTSIDDTNPPRKTSTIHVPQAGTREPANHNHLSSAEGSQYTYDSAWKAPTGKGSEPRRPMTADSAKTSIVDSDDNFGEEEEDEEESN